MKTITTASVLLMVLVVTVGCVGVQTSKNELQRQTLNFIFFGDNPPPPRPTAEELQAIKQEMARAKTHDSAKLHEVYEEDPELWVYATRDTDDDGTTDYRIGDDHGRFMEGDTDIDGDGVPNSLDLDPYRATIGNHDTNHNGVPDHIDWSRQPTKNRNMAEIQEQLYERHSIVLVERSAKFTEALVQGVYDVVTRVFKRLFAEKSKLPTLATVATVQWPALDKETDDETRAQVIAQNGTLTVFQYGMELKNRFLLLGLLGHELSHNIQFSFDYDESDQQDLKKNIYLARNFYRLMEEFGWSFEEEDFDQADIHDQISLQYQAISPYEIRFEGLTSEEWEPILEALGTDYLNDPLVRAAHIVGSYSLSEPWEWHADHMIAYLFIGMEDHAQHFCTDSELEALKARTKADNIEAWSFYHGNARGNKRAINYFRETFPIDDADWAYLTREYLLESYPGVCTKPGA